MKTSDYLTMTIETSRIRFSDDNDPRAVPPLQLESALIDGEHQIIVRGYPYDIGALTRNQVNNLVGALRQWLDEHDFLPAGYDEPLVIDK